MIDVEDEEAEQVRSERNRPISARQVLRHGRVHAAGEGLVLERKPLLDLRDRPDRLDVPLIGPGELRFSEDERGIGTRLDVLPHLP
ncbi:hypothetical protein QFZ26_002977 [Agromyces ramosus]|uniref:Uncharacterized protein n=1 Tax=Agromyces ramosus TaxID=33879 RepID=A0ABU0RCA9_9MICO|nr:hypothetical protein [Agromyces ramosus]MDQ0895422.1 hypothetical protein [Agromyces ramosus]